MVVLVVRCFSLVVFIARYYMEKQKKNKLFAAGKTRLAEFFVLLDSLATGIFYFCR
ncbi:hypothetical protein CI610_02961 [invertebrate metagenome]|uniref:Uncharacterized protein n=1 Tax=invertebrate metagenome TaxID=1711999 RepID=A0A2H9T4E8_9ZZZZ